MELYNTYRSIQYNFATPEMRCGKMAYTEAQKKATARCNKKAYDRIDIVVPKGKREIIKACAASCGISVNRLINDVIDRVLADSQEAGE